MGIYNNFFAQLSPSLMILFWVVLIWSGIWKGFALWRAARREETIWFVVLFVVNTVGILEILYLFIFGKEKEKNKKQSETTPSQKHHNNRRLYKRRGEA